MAHHLRGLFSADRTLEKRPQLADHFLAAFQRDLSAYGFGIPENVEELVRWVYENPNRCPSTRLDFEIYHAILRNTGDIPRDNDFEDFAHIGCLPYVDLITLDNRMRDYVARVDQATGSTYQHQVCKDAKEILARLSSFAGSGDGNQG